MDIIEKTNIFSILLQITIQFGISCLRRFYRKPNKSIISIIQVKICWNCSNKLCIYFDVEVLLLTSMKNNKNTKFIRKISIKKNSIVGWEMYFSVSPHRWWYWSTVKSFSDVDSKSARWAACSAPMRACSCAILSYNVKWRSLARATETLSCGTAERP